MEQVTDQTNFTGIRPAGYQLLVLIPDAKTQEGGILIPESVQVREKAASVVAKVIAMGPDCYLNKEKFPTGPWCKVGDAVSLSPYNGVRIVSPLTKETLRFINDDSILAVLPDESYVERG